MGNGLGVREFRRIIQSQAMSRAVAERRRKGSYGKRNVRHVPICPRPLAYKETRIKPEQSRSDSGSSDLCHNESVGPIVAVVKSAIVAKRVRDFVQCLAVTRVPIWIPASPTSTGYEAMRIRYDFDVLDLSGLTALHVGRATAQSLQDKPSHLLDILRCREWSYFSYIPGRYGYTKCLDDAICCVAARVRQWITNPGRPTSRVLVLYTKAVKSLQAALDNHVQRVSPDVLCATEVLSIFELLDSDRDDAWVTHAAGAATLIQLRGPERYETKIEKALFLGQASPIITEAMLTVSPCFLEEPAWQHLFWTISLGKSVFSAYSDALVEAWACISYVPGLFRGVRSALRNPNKGSQAARGLLNRILDIRSRLTKMRVEQNMISVRASEGKYDLQYDLVGLHATNLTRLERLVAALVSNAVMAAEERAQELSEQVLNLERSAITIDARATLYLRFKILTAKVTINTGEQWREETTNRPANTVMDKDIFDCWVLNICPQRRMKTRIRNETNQQRLS